MSSLKKATIICDMAYGSTGKGLVSGYLAERDQPDVVMTAWSMNAGHTYIDRDGRSFIHCMLANGVVSPALRYVLIGPGSQIGIDKLFQEASQCRDLLEGVQILIHPNACIISQRHIEEENRTMTGIGSTKKGCGAALNEKIQRQTGNTGIVAKDQQGLIGAMAANMGLPIAVTTHERYCEVVESARRIQVEGAQGYSIGMNSGFYPYTTSRECTPAQIASDVLLPLPMIDRVVGTMRTYPIRVANRYDDAGVMVGWSGPHYEDQEEIKFSDIGQETEYTTVTKLPRRVFTFSEEQCRAAMRTVRPDEVVMGFANYATEAYLQGCIAHVERAAFDYGCGGVEYLTWGPTAAHVAEVQDGPLGRQP